jgi:hypothetical protein
LDLYRAAILELDPEKLPKLIEAAHTLVQKRLREVCRTEKTLPRVGNYWMLCKTWKCFVVDNWKSWLNAGSQFPSLLGVGRSVGFLSPAQLCRQL